MTTQRLRTRLTELLLIVLVSFTETAAPAATATVTAGQAVTLAVTVDGSAPFSYQWYKDGVVLAGATTGPDYSIGNVQVASTGVYCVVISNAAGSTTSDNAIINLTATIAPAITTQPVSQTVTAGANVIFTAAASGSPPPAYQWRFNGAAIADATNAALNIANVQAPHAGSYDLVATSNAGSATSNTAILTVNAAMIAPVITTQPQGQTVAAGASVTFTAAASGSPAPTCQWRKDGVNLSGATSTSYTVASAVGGDAGVYSVVATNAAGSAISVDAVLIVNSLPVITTQPISQTVTAGANVTFTAAASGLPTPAYQWRFNGTAIAGATNAALSIANAQTADAGSYNVVATNSAGAATSNTASLTVNAATTAPVFTTQPASKTVKAGSSVTFTAAASGSPAPTYQWRWNGVSLSGATKGSYSIASVTAGDAGIYTVVAANSAGSVTSSNAVLTVNSAAVIATQPVSQTVTAGSLVTFKVTANSSSTLTYQWRKNGAKIRRATGAAYTITNVSSSDAGTYTVVVTNSYGSVTSNGAVLGVTSTTSPVVYRVDFNGDGKSDILWQNSTTGECSVWLMAGTTVGSSVALGTVPAGWRIGGAGDLNNDGQSDILWQNSTTGECNVWLMTGTTVSSNVSLGTASPDWRMRGSGDFNGDGKSDILWQNGVTGECSVWLMAGTTVSSVISLGSASTSLMLTGTGDFNKDGQSDILWQNSATGEYGVWLMAGTTVGSNVSLGLISLDWQMSGAGDFNGDAKSDILWQNLLTGECRVWLMAGTTVSSDVSLGTVPLDWILRN